MDTVRVIIEGEPAQAAVDLSVNGVSVRIPRNVETPIPAHFLPTLIASSYEFELVETESLAGSGGGGDGDPAPVAANRFEQDPASLNTFLDMSIAKIAPLLVNMTEPELRTLLAAEEAGKTRTTLVAAINQSLSGE
jgi:hypothetical protein